MKIVFLTALLVLIAVWIFAKCTGGGSRRIQKEMACGPFTVRVTATQGKQLNMNYGMVNVTDVAYSVLYEGKPVAFPGTLQNNTGLPYLWRVYVLPDAPDPTLLAGSQSLYLIYLKNGQPVVEPVLEQGYDFASVQFLDSENGQPGPRMEVFAKSNTTDMEKIDSLSGGRFLLVSEHAVLDVPTRTIRAFNSDNNSVENYSFPSPHGALAFSPDRSSIVFRGEFQGWNTPDEDLPDSEHALIVYHIEKDTGYAVKFDDTALRLIRTEDMNFAWYKKFFEWKPSASGERLQLRLLEKPPCWTGTLSDQHYYTLYPVKAAMLPAFLDFLQRRKGWTKAHIIEEKYHEYTGRIFTFGIDSIKFDLCLKEDEQVLQFSPNLYEESHKAEASRIVQELAAAFDAELAAGQHQEHFGRIISEQKKIRNLGRE